jgi:hypothetical protein
MDYAQFQNSQEAQLNELELPVADELDLTEDQIEIMLTFARLEGPNLEGGES